MFDNGNGIYKSNLSKQEHKAMKLLSKNENLIVHNADKGGAVVIWGREKYEQEACRQLKNTDYLPLPCNPLENMKKEFGGILENAKDNEWISTQE